MAEDEEPSFPTVFDAPLAIYDDNDVKHLKLKYDSTTLTVDSNNCLSVKSIKPSVSEPIVYVNDSISLAFDDDYLSVDYDGYLTLADKFIEELEDLEERDPVESGGTGGGNSLFISDTRASFLNGLYVKEITNTEGKKQYTELRCNVASLDLFGVVKIGPTLTIDEKCGIVDAKIASKTLLGIVKAGKTLKITDGVIDIPIASTALLGIIRPGEGLEVNAAGVLKTTFDTNKLKNEILNIVYPIGSIYLSINGLYPTGFVNSLWILLNDDMYLQQGSTSNVGSTSIKSVQIPKKQTAICSNTNNHRHDVTISNVDVETLTLKSLRVTVWKRVS